MVTIFLSGSNVSNCTHGVHIYIVKNRLRKNRLRKTMVATRLATMSRSTSLVATTMVAETHGGNHDGKKTMVAKEPFAGKQHYKTMVAGKQWPESYITAEKQVGLILVSNLVTFDIRTKLNMKFLTLYLSSNDELVHFIWIIELNVHGKFIFYQNFDKSRIITVPINLHWGSSRNSCKHIIITSIWLRVSSLWPAAHWSTLIFDTFWLRYWFRYWRIFLNITILLLSYTLKIT